jgi:toxin ParE1/3/4
MNGVKLVAKARSDLAGIWRYTAKRWDRTQADRYLAILKRDINSVALDPRLGQPCDEVRAGYRRRLSGSHAIFYRFAKDHIEIMRVLHQQMDAGRHL